MHATGEAVLRAAGAGTAAVDAVLTGQYRAAFCCVRPPGSALTFTWDGVFSETLVALHLLLFYLQL